MVELGKPGRLRGWRQDDRAGHGHGPVAAHKPEHECHVTTVDQGHRDQVRGRPGGVVHVREPHHGHEGHRHVVHGVQCDRRFQTTGAPRDDAHGHGHDPHRELPPDVVRVTEHEQRHREQDGPRGVLEPPADGLGQVAAEHDLLRRALQGDHEDQRGHEPPETGGRLQGHGPAARGEFQAHGDRVDQGVDRDRRHEAREQPLPPDPPGHGEDQPQGTRAEHQPGQQGAGEHEDHGAEEDEEHHGVQLVHGQQVPVDPLRGREDHDEQEYDGQKQEDGQQDEPLHERHPPAVAGVRVRQTVVEEATGPWRFLDGGRRTGPRGAGVTHDSTVAVTEDAQGPVCRALAVNPGWIRRGAGEFRPRYEMPARGGSARWYRKSRVVRPPGR